MKNLKRQTVSGAKRRWICIIEGVVVVVALAFGALYVFSQIGKTPPAEMKWGVTFSSMAARDLGLDPRVAYQEVVQDLRPNLLRLGAYWSEIEPVQGQYNYEELDYQVQLAEQANIPYIIAIGKKVPRYPECFIPEWVKQLPPSESQKELLAHITRTAKRYNNNRNLAMWQLENEPYYKFGSCPKFNELYFNEEIDTLKQITQRPIMTTDSGEGSWWVKASARSDAFGTTLYRSVLNQKGTVFNHFIPAWLYSLRAQIIKTLHPNIQKVVVAELQAEPWGSPLSQKPQEFTDLTLSHQKFLENIQFAQNTGMPEHYLWGVEWWYFQKQQRNNSVFWNDAQKLFAEGR